MAKPLVIFGSGGHAKVVAEASLAQTPGRQILIIDDADDAQKRLIVGHRVSGGREQLERLAGARVALGIGDNAARAAIMTWLREAGHALETVIHPSATVAESVLIEPGAFISAGAIIIAEARVSAGAIINTGASVDHDCVIGEAAHIGPGAHLCGNVSIGARALVGVGSSLKPGVFVGDDVVLGAGSVVVRDILQAGTYAGNPARPLR